MSYPIIPGAPLHVRRCLPPLPPKPVYSAQADAKAIHRELGHPKEQGAILQTLSRYAQPHRPMAALLRAIDANGDLEALAHLLGTLSDPKERAVLPHLFLAIAENATGPQLAKFTVGLGDGSQTSLTGHQKDFLAQCSRSCDGKTLSELYLHLGPTQKKQVHALGQVPPFEAASPGSPAQSLLLREAARHSSGAVLLDFCDGLAADPNAQQALIQDAAEYAGRQALSTLEQSQAFHRYFVAPTLAQRASAGGPGPDATSPFASAHLVRPGDTVWGIGVSRKDSLPKEEGANPQIPDPHWIYPGQIVFSPGKNPVSGQTQVLIQKALRHGSPQNWRAVQASIAEDFRKDGGSSLEPELRVLPRLDAIDHWAVGTSKLSEAAQAAYEQVYAGWLAQGITRAQLKSVFDAAQALTRAQQAAAQIHHHLLPSGLESTLQQARAKLTDATTHWLGSFPLSEVRSGMPWKWVTQIDASYPGNQDVAAATQAALDSATSTWKQLGVTRSQIEPVLRQYQDYLTTQRQAAAARKTPLAHSPHFPNAPTDTQAPLLAARKALIASIEAHLNPPPAQGRPSPHALLEQKVLRAQALIEAGPQAPQFRKAVYAAMAGLVSQAYGSGHPQAAAQTLRWITQLLPPKEAARIILASSPTLDKIGASGAYQDPSVYGDLSSAVEQTGPGLTQTSLSRYTKAAADAVAAALVPHFPRGNAAPNFLTTLGDAAKMSIGQGEGATLSLAIANALKARGSGNADAGLLVGIVLGYSNLSTKTKADAAAYAKAAGNLPLLVSRWGAAMTPQELHRATSGWIHAHGGAAYQKNCDARLRVLQQDGFAIVQAQQALGAYRSALPYGSTVASRFGAVPSKPLLQNVGAGTSKGLFQDGSAQGAVNLTGLPSLYQAKHRLDGAIREFTKATLEQQAALAKQWHVLLATPSSSDAAPNPASPENPVLAPAQFLQGLRDARTLLNSYLKVRGKTGTKLYKRLPWAGLGISGIQFLSWFLKHPAGVSSDLEQGYNGLGLAKYGLQLANGKTFFGKTFNIPDVALQRLSSAYYFLGAASSGWAAGQDFQHGKYVNGGLNTGSTVGDVMLAIDALGDGGWLGVGGIVIVGAALVGQFIYQAIQSNEQKQALASQGARFLEDGLHLKPDVAQALASENGYHGEGPASALQAFARYRGVPFRSVLEFLNQQKLASVQDFVQLCNRMVPRNGSYPNQAPGDGQYEKTIAASRSQMQNGSFNVHRYTSGRFSMPEVLYEGPSSLRSLKELNDWFQALFPGCQQPQTA
ncbi:MAG: hypothetical protein PHO89_08250 [Methylacidiphilaceae bacterium]|nr:hypothetical protein [Candidatus Methylacidiphilaceae bacterium]